MKNLGLWGGLAVLLLLLSGCPYESKVPLSNPDRFPVNSKLIGLWSGSGDSLTVLVMPFNATEYYIELHEVGDDEIGRIRAFAFEIAGQRFLHYNELTLDGAPARFSFVRFTLSGDTLLSLRIIEDAIVPESLQTDSKGLIKFIESHLDDPKLYDSEFLLRRIPPE
jgi:hypothetical protein